MEDFELDIYLSYSSAGDVGNLLDVDVLSLELSDTADSAFIRCKPRRAGCGC